MSWLRKLGRVYFYFSLAALAVTLFFAVKYYPLLKKGQVPPDVQAALKNLPAVEKVLEKSPLRSAAAYIGLGSMHQMKNEFDEAERLFKKALEIEPNHPDAHLRLAVIYEAQEKWQEAADSYEIGLKRSPDNAQAHNNLGAVYEELGRADEAIKQYEEALRLVPDNSVVKNNLTLALREAGQRAKETEDVKMSTYEDLQRQAASDPNRIDVHEPQKKEEYVFRKPMKITLTNGRSLTGDVTEKDDNGMWLEVGSGMKIYVAREDVSAIEDAS